MPKAKSDFRVAQAILSAPYPLPIIISRQTLQGLPVPSTTPAVTQSMAGSSTIPAPRPFANQAFYNGFPLLNGQHRLSTNPPNDLPQQPGTDPDDRVRRWRIRVNKVKIEMLNVKAIHTKYFVRRVRAGQRRKLARELKVAGRFQSADEAVSKRINWRSRSPLR